MELLILFCFHVSSLWAEGANEVEKETQDTPQEVTSKGFARTMVPIFFKYFKAYILNVSLLLPSPPWFGLTK